MSNGNVARDEFFWNICAGMIWNSWKLRPHNTAAFVGKKEDFKVEEISEPDKTVKGIHHHQFNDFPVKVSDGGDWVWEEGGKKHPVLMVLKTIPLRRWFMCPFHISGKRKAITIPFAAAKLALQRLC